MKRKEKMKKSERKKKNEVPNISQEDHDVDGTDVSLRHDDRVR